jgi:hypothetical protein
VGTPGILLAAEQIDFHRESGGTLLEIDSLDFGEFLLDSLEQFCRRVTLDRLTPDACGLLGFDADGNQQSFRLRLLLLRQNLLRSLLQRLDVSGEWLDILSESVLQLRDWNIQPKLVQLRWLGFIGHNSGCHKLRPRKQAEPHGHHQLPSFAERLRSAAGAAE